MARSTSGTVRASRLIPLWLIGGGYAGSGSKGSIHCKGEAGDDHRAQCHISATVPDRLIEAHAADSSGLKVCSLIHRTLS